MGEARKEHERLVEAAESVWESCVRICVPQEDDETDREFEIRRELSYQMILDYNHKTKSTNLLLHTRELLAIQLNKHIISDLTKEVMDFVGFPKCNAWTRLKPIDLMHLNNKKAFLGIRESLANPDLASFSTMEKTIRKEMVLGKFKKSQKILEQFPYMAMSIPKLKKNLDKFGYYTSVAELDKKYINVAKENIQRQIRKHEAQYNKSYRAYKNNCRAKYEDEIMEYKKWICQGKPGSARNEPKCPRPPSRQNFSVCRIYASDTMILENIICMPPYLVNESGINISMYNHINQDLIKRSYEGITKWVYHFKKWLS